MFLRLLDKALSYVRVRVGNYLKDFISNGSIIAHLTGPGFLATGSAMSPLPVIDTSQHCYGSSFARGNRTEDVKGVVVGSTCRCL